MKYYLVQGVNEPITPNFNGRLLEEDNIWSYNLHFEH